VCVCVCVCVCDVASMRLTYDVNDDVYKQLTQHTATVDTSTGSYPSLLGTYTPPQLSLSISIEH